MAKGKTRPRKGTSANRGRKRASVPEGAGSISQKISLGFNGVPKKLWKDTDKCFSAVMPLRFDSMQIDVALPGSIGWWRFANLRAEWNFNCCMCGTVFMGLFPKSISAQTCSSTDYDSFFKRMEVCTRKTVLKKTEGSLILNIGSTPWISLGEALPASQLYPYHFIYGFNADKPISAASSPLKFHGVLELLEQPFLCAGSTRPQPPTGRVEMCSYHYGGPTEMAKWRWPSDKSECLDDRIPDSNGCVNPHPHERVVR